jgi:beta-glucosidase
LADVLVGDREPGGRLPFAIPATPDHLPPFDPDAREVVYDRWVGQRLLDRDGHRAAYPFGFGLGYTTFEISNLDLEERDGACVARVRVRNTGERAGASVVQLRAFDARAPEGRRVHELVGFARVQASPGEDAEATIPVDLRPLHTRDPDTGEWSRRQGDWQVRAGWHAEDRAGPVVPLG